MEKARTPEPSLLGCTAAFGLLSPLSFPLGTYLGPGRIRGSDAVNRSEEGPWRYQLHRMPITAWKCSFISDWEWTELISRKSPLQEGSFWLCLPHRAEGEGDQKDKCRRQSRILKDRHHLTMMRTKSLFKNDWFLRRRHFPDRSVFFLRMLILRELLDSGYKYLGVVKSFWLRSFSSNCVDLMGLASQETFVCLHEF